MYEIICFYGFKNSSGPAYRYKVAVQIRVLRKHIIRLLPECYQIVNRLRQGSCYNRHGIKPGADLVGIKAKFDGYRLSMMMLHQISIMLFFIANFTISTVLLRFSFCMM
jgi:hypothetical protein